MWVGRGQGGGGGLSVGSLTELSCVVIATIARRGLSLFSWSLVLWEDKLKYVTGGTLDQNGDGGARLSDAAPWRGETV